MIIFNAFLVEFDKPFLAYLKFMCMIFFLTITVFDHAMNDFLDLFCDYLEIFFPSTTFLNFAYVVVNAKVSLTVKCSSVVIHSEITFQMIIICYSVLSTVNT